MTRVPAAATDVIPLARPVMGEREEQAVLEVLRSGHLSLGPRVPAFEAAFAERVGARHASAVSSGTTGLHLALRAAITETYPHLADIKLVNYKVRILDEAKATGAVTRVLLDASDGHDTWGAIGVHENVIEASWDALVDSLEAGMLPGREGHRRGSAERRPA